VKFRYIYIFLLLLLEFGGLYIKWRYLPGRLLPMRIMDETVYNQPPSSKSSYPVWEQQKVRTLSTDLGDINNLDEQSKQSVLRNWTRTQVKQFNLYSRSYYPDEIIECLRTGKTGGSCGPLALVLDAISSINGVQTRRIITTRGQLFDSVDVHVSIETWSDKLNKWYVSDPMFNCYFVTNNDSNISLNAFEIHKLKKKYENDDLAAKGMSNFAAKGVVKAVQDRDKTNPTIQSYYIDPFLLYNRVFVTDLRRTSYYKELPKRIFHRLINRYCTRDKIFYIKPQNESIPADVKFIIGLDYTLTWIIPASILLVFAYKRKGLTTKIAAN
jgi:hypothetical protein